MPNSKPCLIALAFAALAASPGLAQSDDWSRLPQWPRLGDELMHPRHQALVRAVRLGRVRIELEQTRWSDLQRQVGPLKMRVQGDASEHEDWTCFTIQAGVSRFQIWPSGGELMGGQFIDGVTVQEGSPWPVGECPIIDLGPGSVALDSGVWIGTTRSELLKRLGNPSAVRGRDLIYDYEVTIHDPKLGEGGTGGELVFEMHADRVSRFLATKDTSF